MVTKYRFRITTVKIHLQCAENLITVRWKTNSSALFLHNQQTTELQAVENHLRHKLSY